MDSGDVIRIDEEFRDLLTAYGLGWVLVNVDQAVADGIMQEKEIEKLRRAGRGQHAAIYGETNAYVVDVGDYSYGPQPWVASPGSTRRSVETGITIRPYSARERLILTIESAQRIVAELPMAAVLTRQKLAESLDVPVSDIAVKFAGGLQGEAVGANVDRYDPDNETRAALVTVLDRLKEEVQRDDS